MFFKGQDIGNLCVNICYWSEFSLVFAGVSTYIPYVPPHIDLA